MDSVLVEESNLATFRDCLFEVIVAKLNPSPKTPNKSLKSHNRAAAKPDIGLSSTSATANDPSELAEFSDFIAGEAFSSLPPDLRTLSYRALEESPELAEKWSLPMSLSVFEEIADGMNPSVADDLNAYGLTKPPVSDVQSFISPVVTAYVGAVTIPPPKWIATKVTACEICDRDWVPMTYHHLIPREVHAKVLKRGWHEEHMLNSVAWLCRACHTFVHKMASNEELAKEWFTTDRICSRDDVQKWAQWVGKIRWKKT